MRSPEAKSSIEQEQRRPHRTDRPLAILLAATMATFAPMNAAHAAEDVAAVPPAASAADSELSFVPNDYRLAPGDRLNILVYDQPQLSGEFVVDGGGGVLLPIIGSVDLKGHTLPEAQQLIQKRFADGVLVQPSVNVSIKQYRPVFVTGSVRKPGSYPFIIGQSVKAAIAAAGGEGEPIEQALNGAVADYITTEQRVRELESSHTILMMRKARLEAQRDGQANFIMPLAVGLGPRTVDFTLAYSAENDTLSRLADIYRSQVSVLQNQRPRIESEISAVNDQIAKQKERLAIVNDRLADLEALFGKGLLRKEVLINQQIEKSLVEGQISNLEAQIAHLRQTMGDLDVRLTETKASYLRQTLTELQDTVQRLHEVDANLDPARRLLRVRAQGAGDFDDSDYIIRISRLRDGGMITFDVTGDTMVLPGDVVEVKLKHPVPIDAPSSLSTQAARELEAMPTVAESVAISPR